jgi:hypothetical protein
MSGLSGVRTIQRIEAGQPASTETLKSIAAVFEVDFNPESETATNVAGLQDQQEKETFAYVGIRESAPLPGTLVAWAIGGWGLAVLVDAFRVFRPDSTGPGVGAPAGRDRDAPCGAQARGASLRAAIGKHGRRHQQSAASAHHISRSYPLLRTLCRRARRRGTRRPMREHHDAEQRREIPHAVQLGDQAHRWRDRRQVRESDAGGEQEEGHLGLRRIEENQDEDGARGVDASERELHAPPRIALPTHRLPAMLKSPMIASDQC